MLRFAEAEKRYKVSQPDPQPERIGDRRTKTLKVIGHNRHVPNDHDPDVKSTYYLQPDPEAPLELVAEIFKKKRPRETRLLQQMARYALKTWHASRRYFR